MRIFILSMLLGLAMIGTAFAAADGDMTERPRPESTAWADFASVERNSENTNVPTVAGAEQYTTPFGAMQGLVVYDLRDLDNIIAIPVGAGLPVEAYQAN